MTRIIRKKIETHALEWSVMELETHALRTINRVQDLCFLLLVFSVLRLQVCNLSSSLINEILISL